MKRKVPYIVNIAILTMIVAVSWLFFTVFRTFKKSASEVVPEELLNPLNPKLDTKGIQSLKDRFFIETSDVQFIVNSSPSPTPQEEILIEEEIPLLESLETPTPEPEALGTVTPVPTEIPGG